MEILDLSNNRLSSLCSLKLDSMHNLHTINLQSNRLLHCCLIPSWIHCNMEGNGMYSSESYSSSSVEMDVIDAEISDRGREASPDTSSYASTTSSVIRRRFATRRHNKEQNHFKHRYLNGHLFRNTPKNFGNCSAKIEKATETYNSEDVIVQGSESVVDDESDSLFLDGLSKDAVSGEYQNRELDDKVRDIKSSLKNRFTMGNISSAAPNLSSSNEDSIECLEDASISSSDRDSEPTVAVSGVSKFKSKRNRDACPDNHKPYKRRTTVCNSNLSWKFSNESFCGIEDHLVDGFYDAGRDRPFMPLEEYEKIMDLNSREVILVDRDKDTELHATLQLARASVFNLKQLARSINSREEDTTSNLHIASLLALFVSDHFGGTDRNTVLERTQRNVFSSDYQKPFVCTCGTGNTVCSRSNKRASSTVEDVDFNDLCEKSLRSIKRRRNSIVIPLGTLRFGVCRHRALLMKYLCDRMDPPVPCELVRGYLDFMRHAWNIILVKRGDSWVRMLVDACRPHDIREERDSEFFSRYIPLSRSHMSGVTLIDPDAFSCFSSLSTSKEVENGATRSVLRCKLGSLNAVAKIRTLEVSGSSMNEVMNFEHNCLGEVRILGALKHPCIVESYGHQISSKWTLSCDEHSDRRILQSSILLEYIEGGSLKEYLDKLVSANEGHVPVELALCIARDVACGLTELHSKHIIHRDLKSENILIDLDTKKADGSPTVKLCDFDRAVPLRSFLHTCCIAHAGIPPPDTCVGTPRWMAPEVLHAMHERKIYGLEVDIWSYGCILYEMLTLQVPYAGLSDSTIHDLIQMGQRPDLPIEFQKALQAAEKPAMDQSCSDPPEASETANLESLSFLLDLFQQCTQNNPADRPTAQKIQEMLLKHMDTRPVNPYSG
uniref:Protein kinase domain-containing protein n=1 Tax=Kalanchoe fedtschenkoi TaxID=63787 RepID=A0A7N0TF83_KALFE